jgi:hypothetical protein
MGDNKNIYNTNYEKEHRNQKLSYKRNWKETKCIKPNLQPYSKTFLQRSTTVLTFFNIHLLLPPSSEQELNLRTSIVQTYMKRLKHHFGLLYNLTASLLIRGTNPYEIFRLSWLIWFVKHAWADSL